MSKKKILLTDDNPEIRSFIEATLVDEGYEVTIAINGDEMLKKLSGDKFDLILTDVMMPGKSGFHAIQELRQSASGAGSIPVLVMSGRKSAGDLFEKDDISGFLQKPFKPDQLVEKVKAILGD